MFEPGRVHIMQLAQWLSPPNGDEKINQSYRPATISVTPMDWALLADEAMRQNQVRRAKELIEFAFWAADAAEQLAGALPLRHAQE